MVAYKKLLLSSPLPTHQIPFPSPLSRDDIGVLERTQERIHQKEWKERTRDVSTHGRESMLICYLLIADDRPESVSLFLSPLPLGVGMGAQGSTLEGIGQEDKDVGREWRQRKGLGCSIAGVSSALHPSPLDPLSQCDYRGARKHAAKEPGERRQQEANVDTRAPRWSTV